jgi:hypothetical protein
VHRRCAERPGTGDQPGRRPEGCVITVKEGAGLGPGSETKGNRNADISDYELFKLQK